MILQKKTINNVPTLVPLTADTGSGVPVGTIIGQYKKVNMAGYLYLDGSTFDQTLYPALYAYLGTNVLPDYREFVLVGAEQNTTSTVINQTNHNHDVFSQGEEKDDRVQNFGLDAGVTPGQANLIGMGTTSVGSKPLSTFTSSGTRIGDTTRTKEKAVFWYIKATTGIIESEATEMLNVFNDRITLDYSTRQFTTGQNFTATKHMRMNFLLCTNTSNISVQVNGISVGVLDNTPSGEWILIANLDLYPGDVVIFSLTGGRLELIEYKA